MKMAAQPQFDGLSDASDVWREPVPMRQRRDGYTGPDDALLQPCELIFARFVPNIAVCLTLRTESGRRTYEMSKTLAIRFTSGPDRRVHAAHRTLPVRGSGRSERQAMAAFIEMFDSEYQDLMSRPSADLAEGAKRAKDEFARFVASVTTDGGVRFSDNPGRESASRILGDRSALAAAWNQTLASMRQRGSFDVDAVVARAAANLAAGRVNPAPALTDTPADLLAED